MTLLREIQTDLATANSEVTALLRKCKILAARLGSRELSEWVDYELNGYPDEQPIPDYRHLNAGCYASFMNIAWRAENQAVLWELFPPEARAAYENIEFREGIARVTAFAGKGCTIVRPELAVRLSGTMFPDMDCYGAYQKISGGEFEQLFSAIKNRLLDLVLQIEAENPAAGEAAINSHPVPEDRLQPIVNNFFGHVSNLAQHSHDFSQTANAGIQPQDLVTLVTEFTNHIDELKLTAEQKRIAEAQIATLTAQLAVTPDPIIVQQAGRTLRNITEGAIGSLVAAALQPGVWETVQSLLGNFPHK